MKQIQGWLGEAMKALEGSRLPECCNLHNPKDLRGKFNGQPVAIMYKGDERRVGILSADPAQSQEIDPDLPVRRLLGVNQASSNPDGKNHLLLINFSNPPVLREILPVLSAG